MTDELIKKLIEAVADEVYENGPDHETDFASTKVDGIIYDMSVIVTTDWTEKVCDKDDLDVPPTIEQRVSMYITSMSVQDEKGNEFDVPDEYLGKEIRRS